MTNLLPQTLLVIAAVGTLGLVALGADGPRTAESSATTAEGAANSVKAAPTQMQDGIVKMDGAHWLVNSGQRTKVGKDITLPSGVTIDDAGKITLNGGKTVTLQDGQFVSMQGEVMDAPKALTESGETIPARRSVEGTLSPQANVNLASEKEDAAPASAGTDKKPVEAR